VESVVVPIANAAEADLVGDVRVRAARSLGELRVCLKGEEPWPDWDPPAPPRDDGTGDIDDETVDLTDVRGLPFAREALEVAAAGGHHLLFCGPPGTGKTMLAQRLGTILPPLSHPEALEVTRIHSAAGIAVGGRLAQRRPFRAPHHTASTAALVGGGSGRARPGEITLAHRGTLFLDELGEFAPTSLDALRQPLEERAVRISRQGVSLTFPAAFQLVACSNPCPCGSAGNECRCSDAQRERYRRRLSAPLLDRFDLRVRVDAPEASDVTGESSAEVAARVAVAYERQRARYADWPWTQNAHVAAGAVPRLLPLGADADDVWRELIADRALTGRGATRIRRVARTLADLDDSAGITADHLETASGLRGDGPGTRGTVPVPRRSIPWRWRRRRWRRSPT
jgi:magnesium chelatase family protein